MTKVKQYLCTEERLKILALHILARRQEYMVKNILKVHVKGRQWYYSCCKIVKEQEANLLFNFPFSSSAQEKQLCGSCCLTSYSLPASISCSVVGDKKLQQTIDNRALSIQTIDFSVLLKLQRSQGKDLCRNWRNQGISPDQISV